MQRQFIIMFLALIVFRQMGWSQDTSHAVTPEDLGEVKGAVEGVSETVLEMKSTLDALKKIKLSGYIQTQFQAAETAGVASFAGGDFPKNVRSRFAVRRGRFKINYDNDLTQYVLEADVSSSGVSLKDAYIWIREPWLKTFALTAGSFYRPFGYEVLHSHSIIETPEFARTVQTLLPGERDLGAQIEVTAEEGPWSYVNIRAGLFNGVLNTAGENDRYKDFIARVGFQLPFEEHNLSIDGGFSTYLGKVTNNSKYVYDIDPTTAKPVYRVDSTATNVSGSYGRTYFGGDFQISYDALPFGGTALRGEYIAGQQPGTASSNSFYNPSSANTPLYVRNFRGWYALLLQNVGLKNQFVVKYDVFDPNTDVQGSDIGATGSNLSPTDVMYSTLGLGWIYHWDTNVKVMLYYDLVTNEGINSTATGPLAPYREDLKDNVFTLRTQFKF